MTTSLSPTPLLADHLSLIQRRWPLVSVTPVGDGSHVVTVPEVQLVDGWNRDRLTITFIVPVGFPMAVPADFWTPPDLGYLSRDGRAWLHPQWTQPAQLPFSGTPALYHYLRLRLWSPLNDTLLTFLNVCRQRLMILR